MEIKKNVVAEIVVVCISPQGLMIMFGVQIKARISNADFQGKQAFPT